MTEHVVAALIEALSDDDSNVRWRAAEALGRFGESAGAARRALERLVADDPTGHVADALAAIGRRGAE